MKQHLRSINFFLLIFLCTLLLKAQNLPEDFLIGGNCVNMHSPYQDSISYINFSQIHECGLNAVFQKARWNGDLINLDKLNEFTYVYAANDSSPDWVNNPDNTDWISYFTHAKYFRWEAEGDDNFPYNSDENRAIVGIKHNHIGYATTDGWSSGTGNNGAYFIDGPDYTQYKRYVYTNRNLNNPNIQYDVVFSLKLAEIPENVTDAARILVTVFDTNTGIESPPIDSRVISTQELSTQYKQFVISYSYTDVSQDLLSEYSQPTPGMDWIPMGGAKTAPWFDLTKKVRFKVQKLNGPEVIVDYIEVFDEQIYGFYFNEHYNELVSKISNYLAHYNEIDSTLYFGTIDEPHSWDAFIPIQKVQHILDSLTIGRNLLVHFYPEWNNRKEGVTVLDKWVNLAQPEKLMFWYAPFTCWYENTQHCDPNPQEVTFWDLRNDLQTAHLLQPKFYMTLQVWGTYDYDQEDYSGYYTPSPEGINAETMLSLAHGVTGIFYEDYYSYYYFRQPHPSPPSGIIEGLVDVPEHGFTTSARWYKVRSLANRLTGTLGQTLMKLNYSASSTDEGYLRLALNLDSRVPETQSTVTHNFLTLNTSGQNGPSASYNFHTGFFKKQSDNNYFLLANLISDTDKYVNMVLTPPDEVSGYHNYRFHNIEENFSVDTTFEDIISLDYLFPAGEGYLFQVAPVIKYGGKLLYDELTGDGITLTDDMIIDNGAELSVYEDYYVDGNIIIKNGSIINQEGGIIHFRDGKKLIIEGNASIHGTLPDKLIFDFDTPDGSNGIIINSGGSLNMTYCLIKNAGTGINAETNYNASSGTLNIQYVDFENCSNSCITIQGQAAGDQIPSLPPPVIKYCNMSLSDYGVWVSNLAQVLIRENHITNTDMGIFLSNVSAPQVIGNTIQTSTYQLPGIFLESSNGLVRSNWISGHTHGIQLGNSSPDIGGNTIENNLNRGLYVGSGSLPDMQARLARDPDHTNVWYAVSGYNKISNNGGWSPDDDGSEIFINNADVIMKGGCNEITDQRIPNANESNHLYNTRLLMNCTGSFTEIEVHAELNFWDEHPLYPLEERFGDCIIYFDPVTNPCPLPEGGEGQLLITSSSGEVVDTLYAEQRTVGTLSQTETAYAEAEEKFLTADYQGAENIYDGIINSEDSVNAKLFAYRRLFETGRLLRKDENYFSGLRDSYLSLAGAMNDSVRAKVFNHLSTLSLVAREDYIPAISEFDEIIQQNPNSEEAVFAEIDAVTAALLLEGGDTTLNKSRLGKYLIKPGSNYFTRMDEIIRKNFGNGMETESEEMNPTEYSLYNNYPNPFNPTTVIRFDIPERTNVELVVYDILGRRVKSLVDNEVRNPGRYEVNFNASELASGVYIYRITTKDYSQARKMLLVK